MTNNLKIALFILVALFGIYLLNLRSQGKLESTSTAIFTDDLEDIFKVLIQQGEDAIELTRIDTLWKISGNDSLVTKPRSIANLFDKVLKVTRGTIISENPNKYGKYSLDDSTGTHLAVVNSKGETVGYYVFGRSKSDYSRSYVRVGNDSKVYLADQNVIYMLSTRETYWGEKPKEEPPLPVDIPKDTTRN
mgnify:CR=1 FL=1|tara:strand:- start:12 stop:584 length:573 start_codon:yes stop_codon:yes gene_type:complete